MMMLSFASLLGITQGVLVILFLVCASSPSDNGIDNFTTHEYIVFRDVMVMLLLGFGYLMAFLYKYGLSAVSFTMLLTVMAMQINFFTEPLVRLMYKGQSAVPYPLPLSLASLIDGEFSAATLLISFGVVIGRATPVQLLLMAVCQSIFYAMNKVLIVFGAFQAEDVGGQ
jgi:ammonium transporter Rh